jgi:hypothetical protein
MPAKTLQELATISVVEEDLLAIEPAVIDVKRCVRGGRGFACVPKWHGVCRQSHMTLRCESRRERNKSGTALHQCAHGAVAMHIHPQPQFAQTAWESPFLSLGWPRRPA